MMKMTKRICCILLLAMMILTLPESIYASSKISMKKTKVKWDLKPDRKYRVKSRYLGGGLQNMDIYITNFKKSKKNGKVTITFKVTFDLTVFRPTKSQVHKMIAALNRTGDEDLGGNGCCYILDYPTGRNLDYEDYDWDFEWDPELDDNYDEEVYDDVDEYIEDLRIDTDVRVSVKDLKIYGKVTTYDNDGCYVWVAKYPYKYKITYPATYKNLCIGIGGCSYLYTDETEEKFNCGVTAFGNMREYKARPSNWHFMRVR